MPAKKVTKKVVREPKAVKPPTEIELLRKRNEELEYENFGLRMGMAEVAKMNQSISYDYLQDMKAFCIRLGGDITIDNITRVSALDPLLKIQQEYDQYGGCRYVLTKEKAENEK